MDPSLSISPFSINLIGLEGPYSVAYRPNRDEGILSVRIAGVEMEWHVDVAEIGVDGQLTLGGLTHGTKDLWSDVYWFELRRGAVTQMTFYGNGVIIRTDKPA